MDKHQINIRSEVWDFLCVDRVIYVVYDAYKINIECVDSSKDILMREVYVLDQNQI
jgi:hypothetical protein